MGQERPGGVQPQWDTVCAANGCEICVTSLKIILTKTKLERTIT